MAGRSGIFVTKDTLGKKLVTSMAEIGGLVWAAMNYEAPRLEGHMKRTAPWQDQTSNARNGLKARAGHKGDEFWIDLFHTMPYGIYLETRWSGRYAVIVPTITSQMPSVMRTVAAAVGGRTSR